MTLCLCITAFVHSSLILIQFLHLPYPPLSDNEYLKMTAETFILFGLSYIYEAPASCGALCGIQG